MTLALSRHLDAPVIEAIYAAYEKRAANEKPRRYLGASIIGKDCNRALWYDFRWATRAQFDGRMLRLFDTGHHEEPRMVADLRAIGANVFAFDPATGQQFSFDDVYGHMAGHMDACAEKIPGTSKAWHVLEFKTHNTKSYAALVKQGVKEAKPLHWAQMQLYMGWSGMTEAMYLAKCKDTDALYAEHVAFDQGAFDKLRAKGEKIIFAVEPPLRLSDDPDYYQCKMCDHKAVCFGQRVPPKSCRTCVHATPCRTANAEWDCDLHHHTIPYEEQLTGCPDHLHIPPLLQYAEAMWAEPMFIIYQHKGTGRHFAVATATGTPDPEIVESFDARMPVYTSDEIAAARPEQITDPEIDDMRREFGGRIAGPL